MVQATFDELVLQSPAVLEQRIYEILDSVRLTPQDGLVSTYGFSAEAFDFKKIVGLPDDEFERVYLATMAEYQITDGLWKNEKPPTCGECTEPIVGPRDLRRYYGQSLHPGCFQVVHGREPISKNGMGSYWDRVAGLDLTNASLGPFPDAEDSNSS